MSAGLRTTLSRAAVAVAAVLAALCARTPSASAQLEPVTVSVHGIFGDLAFLPDGYGTVVVELENRTRRTLRGSAVMLVGQPYGGGARLRHELAVDLPPRARRRVLFTVFAGANGTTAAGSFELDGRKVAEQSISTNYSAGSRSLVLLADPPRIRAGVLDLEIDLIDPRSGGAARTVRVPLGIATTDPRTG